MHYVSADSLWFCSNFSSVLIVMQVVAMGLCFGDDAIWCAFVINQTEACLDLKQHSDAVNSPPGSNQHFKIVNALTKCWQRSLASPAVKIWDIDRRAFCWTSCKGLFVPSHFIFATKPFLQLIPKAGGHSSLQNENPAPAFILLS